MSVTQECTFILLKYLVLPVPLRNRVAFFFRQFAEIKLTWWKSGQSYGARWALVLQTSVQWFSLLFSPLDNCFLSICLVQSAYTALSDDWRKHKTSRLNELWVGCSLWFPLICLLSSFFLFHNSLRLQLSNAFIWMFVLNFLFPSPNGKSVPYWNIQSRRWRIFQLDLRRMGMWGQASKLV